jgi:dethiobiotin synthetase
MRGLLITGTDTGVGKTFIAAALARVLRARGINVGIMKPFAAAKKIFSRRYRSEDTAILARAAHSIDSDKDMNPFFYSVPSAPYVASAVTRQEEVCISTVLDAYDYLSAKHDIMIVEGIGGLMVPLTETETFADFAKTLNLPIIVVARCSLGTLNHILLTVNASKAYGLDVMGLVMNGYPQRERAVDKQLVIAVKKLAGVEVLCVVPKIEVTNIHFKLEDIVVDKILHRLNFGTSVSDFQNDLIN